MTSTSGSPPQSSTTPAQELGTLTQLLQLIGQYGLPLVLSVVLIGYLLVSVDRTQREQAALLQQITATHEQIARSLDRMSTAIDALNNKIVLGGGTLVPLR